MRGAPGWTPQQNEALIAGYRNPRVTAEDIADVLMVTADSVKNQARKLGLISHRRIPPKLISVKDSVATFRLPGAGGGFSILIDDSDAEWFSSFSHGWLVHLDQGSVPYVYSRRPSGKLHRLLLNAAPGQLVDHKNRNGLDNRRANLRLADTKQNCHNSGPRTHARSQYKGVWQHPNGRYHGRVKAPDGRRYTTGYHHSEVEAARAHDALVKLFRGDFAYLNFPDDPLSAAEIMAHPALRRIYERSAA